MAISKFTTAAILAASLTTPAQAEIDGNWLKDTCNNESPGYMGFCRGYVVGVSQFSRFPCAPVGMGMVQEVAIIVKYLADHPERLHVPAKELVGEAVNNAFPCKGGE
jgi:hypothetical protein